MGKRILSLILALTVILSAFCFTASAAETVDEKTAVLQSLGILDNSLVKKVCYDSYVKSVMNLVFTGEAITTESFARSIGFIGKDEKYIAADPITLGNAVKLAVIASGYKVAAEDGTLQSYITAGYRIGLFDGIKGGATDKLSKENAITLLYNLLEVEPLIWSYPDNYEVQDKEDILGMYKGIYLHKGIVTANEYTALNGIKGVREDEVAINGEVFKTTVEYDPEILGKPVEVYIKENKGEDPVVVYIGVAEGKYNSLTIEADDIETVAPDFSEIEYLEAENDRIREAELESPLKVIYNGKFYGEYTVADLMPEIGEITLIDSNGEAGYEIVKVTSYQTMVVEAVNTTDKIVTSKYDFANCLNFISLDGNDVIYSVIKNDTEIALSAIMTGDVLSVLETKSAGDKIYKIYVSSDSEESAVVSLLPEEKEIETEEDTYKYTAEFERHLADKGQQIQLGKRYTFLFDVFGNIVYSIRTMDNDYALLFKTGTKGGMDNDVEIKYLTIDGDWKVSKVAEKINYGVGTETEKITAARFNTLLGAEDPQVVKLKQNEAGEITSVITAKETGVYMDGVFRKTAETTIRYSDFAKTFGCQYYIGSDTKMFILPATRSSDEDDYYVSSALDVIRNDKDYPLRAYDTDNFGFTDLISVTETDGVKDFGIGQSLFVVTGIGHGLSADGEACVKYTGSIGGLRNISFLATSDCAVTDLPTGVSAISAGDIVRIRFKRNGQVDKIKYVDTANGTFTLNGPTGYYNGCLLRAKVDDIDVPNGRVKFDAGSKVSFRISSSVSCVTYNRTKKKCDLSTTYELMKDDEVFVRLFQNNIAEIIKVVD